MTLPGLSRPLLPARVERPSGVRAGRAEAPSRCASVQAEVWVTWSRRTPPTRPAVPRRSTRPGPQRSRNGSSPSRPRSAPAGNTPPPPGSSNPTRRGCRGSCEASRSRSEGSSATLEDAPGTTQAFCRTRRIGGNSSRQNAETTVRCTGEGKRTAAVRCRAREEAAIDPSSKPPTASVRGNVPASVRCGRRPAASCYGGIGPGGAPRYAGSDLATARRMLTGTPLDF